MFALTKHPVELVALAVKGQRPVDGGQEIEVRIGLKLDILDEWLTSDSSVQFMLDFELEALALLVKGQRDREGEEGKNTHGIAIKRSFGTQTIILHRGNTKVEVRGHCIGSPVARSVEGQPYLKVSFEGHINSKDSEKLSRCMGDLGVKLTSTSDQLSLLDAV